MAVRQLIFEVASRTEGVGELTETLKWGEPAYLTPSKSGSTIRLGFKDDDPGHVAMYFNCQTTLVGDMRRAHRGEFEFADNRAVLIAVGGRMPRQAVANCIMLALTYHYRKKGR